MAGKNSARAAANGSLPHERTAVAARAVLSVDGDPLLRMFRAAVNRKDTRAPTRPAPGARPDSRSGFPFFIRLTIATTVSHAVRPFAALIVRATGPQTTKATDAHTTRLTTGTTSPEAGRATTAHTARATTALSNPVTSPATAGETSPKTIGPTVGDTTIQTVPGTVPPLVRGFTTGTTNRTPDGTPSHVSVVVSGTWPRQHRCCPPSV